ncbi:MAG: methylated-DNA--[protein]-cysteine S-methyltransferase [Chitinophagales bacterium]
MTISFVIFETSWGWVGLAGNNIGVACLTLPAPSPLITYESLLTEMGPSISENAALFPEVRQQIISYFRGDRIIQWNAPVVVEGYSSFQQAVLKETALIPYGCTLTYGEVANRIGRPKTARAIGQTLGRNRIAIMIPCHRVVGKDSLGGFSAPGGLVTKKALLKLEGITV